MQTSESFATFQNQAKIKIGDRGLCIQTLERQKARKSNVCIGKATV